MECIAEDPELPSNGPPKLVPFVDFGSVEFDNCSAILDYRAGLTPHRNTEHIHSGQAQNLRTRSGEDWPNYPQWSYRESYRELYCDPGHGLSRRLITWSAIVDPIPTSRQGIPLQPHWLPVRRGHTHSGACSQSPHSISATLMVANRRECRSYHIRSPTLGTESSMTACRHRTSKTMDDKDEQHAQGQQQSAEHRSNFHRPIDTMAYCPVHDCLQYSTASR